MIERPNGEEPPPHIAGEATEDLSRRLASLAPEHPAVSEARIRARSRHLIAGGGALTLAIMIIATVWHIGFGSFLPAAYVIPAYAVSCGAILIGCLEYITRQSRAQQAEALRIALQVQADQLRLVDLLGEELKQQFFKGGASTLRDQFDIPRTGTGPIVGRAPAGNRSGGDVVELRRRAAGGNDAHF